MLGSIAGQGDGDKLSATIPLIISVSHLGDNQFSIEGRGKVQRAIVRDLQVAMCEVLLLISDCFDVPYPDRVNSLTPVLNSPLWTGNLRAGKFPLGEGTFQFTVFSIRIYY